MSLFEIFLAIALGFLLLRIGSALLGDHDSGGSGDFHDGDSGGADGGHGGVFFSSFLTFRNFAHFGVGFGASGAIATSLGFEPWSSIGFALFGGCALAVVGALFFAVVRRQQGNTVPNANQLVGKKARVVTSIPQGGTGEIQTQNEFGTTTTLPAQSRDMAVMAGAQVEILSVIANTAIVKAVS